MVRTDQQSLRYLTQQREIGGEYHKWMTKLMGYSFEIQFKAGSSNKVADALSRKNVGDLVLATMVTVNGVDWSELFEEVQRDLLLKQIKLELENKTKEHKGFSLMDGHLLYKGRVVIPSNSKFKGLLLSEYHCTAVGGHAGETKTYLRLSAEWYWVEVRKDVTRFVQQCVICQQNKLRLDYCSHFHCQPEFGRIYPWILSKGCRTRKGWIQFS